MRWQTKLKRLSAARDKVHAAARVVAQCWAEREFADEEHGVALKAHKEALSNLEQEVLRIERIEGAARAKVAAARAPKGGAK
jgi:hypothetical protein